MTPIVGDELARFAYRADEVDDIRGAFNDANARATAAIAEVNGAMHDLAHAANSLREMRRHMRRMHKLCAVITQMLVLQVEK